MVATVEGWHTKTDAGWFVTYSANELVLAHRNIDERSPYEPGAYVIEPGHDAWVVGDERRRLRVRAADGRGIREGLEKSLLRGLRRLAATGRAEPDAPRARLAERLLWQRLRGRRPRCPRSRPPAWLRRARPTRRGSRLRSRRSASPACRVRRLRRPSSAISAASSAIRSGTSTVSLACRVASLAEQRSVRLGVLTTERLRRRGERPRPRRELVLARKRSGQLSEPGSEHEHGSSRRPRRERLSPTHRRSRAWLGVATPREARLLEEGASEGNPVSPTRTVRWCGRARRCRR